MSRELTSGARDVGEWLDGASLKTLHGATFLLGVLCMTFEGYDTFAVSYIGPRLQSLWHLAPSVLGVVFTSGTAASALGYLAIGPLADRIGRRQPVIWGTALFGLASIASTTAGGATSFIIWRILVGLALGAVLPNIVAIAAEISPLRRRSFVVAFLYSGFAIGSASAGLLAAHLLPHFGWGSVLWVGGAVPVMLALVMGAALPESPRFIALHDPQDPRLPRLMRQLVGDAGVTGATIWTLAGEQLRRQPMRDIFVGGRALSTLMIWIVLTMDVTTIAALVFWIPSLLSASGQLSTQGVNFSVVLLIGGMLGAWFLGWCMDRFGAYRALIPAHIAASAFIVLFALQVQAAPVLVALLIGLTLNGGTSGCQGLLARLYPTALRTTGVGWASAVSRLASTAQPLILGVMLAAHWPPATALLACSVPTVIALAGLTILSRDQFGIAASLRQP